MSTSPFFSELCSAYQAEIDDLSFDSEGKNVLEKRLKEKRTQIGFLVQMLETNPEMVAVVLHQAFRFTSPSAMNHLLAQDADELPDWTSLSESIEIAPWAQNLVKTILKEPRGDWCLILAAALEYRYGHLDPHRAESDDETRAGEEDRDLVRVQRHDDNHTEDHDAEEDEARVRDEAGNDWLEAQGFDRKE